MKNGVVSNIEDLLSKDVSFLEQVIVDKSFSSCVLTEDNYKEILEYLCQLSIQEQEHAMFNIEYLIDRLPNISIFEKIRQQYHAKIAEEKENVELDYDESQSKLKYALEKCEELQTEYDEIVKNYSALREELNESKTQLDNGIQDLANQIELSKEAHKEIEREIETLQSSISTAQENLTGSILEQEMDFNEQMKSSQSDLVTLTVTVLGIFTALAFVLTGSVTILGNVFVVDASIAETLFKFGLVGIFVADIAFLLIYSIARLNGKSVAMHCSHTNNSSKICTVCKVNTEEKSYKYAVKCHGCIHRNIGCNECETAHFPKAKWICKLFHKFLYIGIINFLCIGAILISIVLLLFGAGSVRFSDQQEVPTEEVSEATVEDSTNVYVDSIENVSNGN